MLHKFERILPVLDIKMQQKQGKQRKSRELTIQILLRVGGAGKQHLLQDTPECTPRARMYVHKNTPLHPLLTSLSFYYFTS